MRKSVRILFLIFAFSIVISNTYAQITPQPSNLQKSTASLDKQKKEDTNVIINQTPDVANKLLFKTILEKYKGKVVVVDFWATWCGPCRRAMKEAAPVKKEFEGKDVVFLYLTGETSPIQDWNKMIMDMSGEHYRFTEAQWKYLRQTLGVKGVPTYFIINKKGDRTHKSTGFMGVDDMRKWIFENL